MSINLSSSDSRMSVPWQLWVVIVLLALEGIGNLLQIPGVPMAAVWLSAKVFFIAGFLRRWRPAYVLFLPVAALHVVAFALQAPFVALLNLVMLLLVASQFRWFFPAGFRTVPQNAP